MGYIIVRHCFRKLEATFLCLRFCSNADLVADEISRVEHSAKV